MQSQQQSTVGPPTGPSVAPPTGTDNLFAGYQAEAGRFDELTSPDGRRRPGWDKFSQLLNTMGASEFTRRWEHSQHLIYENGVSYSAYGDPEDNARPWDLDALPMLIDEAEWKHVSAGIAQRAEVLQLTLGDLLGPQRLIKDGVLPAELLFGHPGFRLPFHSQTPPGGSYLPFYAADLGRSPDGRWWVLADRTEAPSGIGFALENRVVISRMLPDVFRSMNVQRLAPFFIQFKEKVRELSPHGEENPRIAIYTRGPKHENYFEDAYLARYLGYTLVEGDDLAIRENRVWLKTLDGLLPIHVLVRRPNSEACDPLEFSDESTLGVAGLLNSSRDGEVSVINPLGSGLVESPAFMAFLPRLCRFFLNQDPILPGVATWWCGEAPSLDRVLSNPQQLVVSQAYRSRGTGYDADKQLNSVLPSELADRIRSHPTRFVAQERLKLSTVPTWDQGTAGTAHMVLRSFAVATGDSYSVLPGGLARTSDASSPPPLAIPASKGSKDAWVLSSQPVDHVTLLSTKEEAIEIRRTATELPSRVADNIFWLGRQIERADASARQLRTFVLRLTSEMAVGPTAVPTGLLRALASQGQIEPDFALEDIRHHMPQLEEALPDLVFDREQVGSIRSVLNNMFRTASLVRDRLSTDSWRVLVRIDQTFCVPKDGPLDLTDLLSMLNRLVVQLAAIEGMCLESMTRSHVFRFLELGRRLERALQTVGLLQSCLIDSPPPSSEVLDALLEIADSVMTYRSRYRANLQLSAVVDLLLTDESNPRSIAYQLLTVEKVSKQLPGEDYPAGYLPHERLILSMVHAVRMVDVMGTCEAYSVGEQQRLAELLETLDQDLQNLSRELSLRYLVHAGPARRMSSTAEKRVS
ncbi:circularly permuted type 2 ATP-grasp protein [Aeoliella sp. ICT_H6.2]|uniref:Circularly permuted type 2 ATP-grasp protein n=1 Tax=Aeoliella straminimaris TaxID=2954799 RepID=A0A9X2FCQ1_9BACT|nr:circularly permuted type 2 ATP-grasp protein [Aeoliella straminimaris]MCO6046545.1 circularly permuted type 2 ATP-grasp protein [Aeoliella straminimaris]